MKPLTHAERVAVNSRVAQANRSAFDAAGVTVVSVIGPAGSGKTSAIEALLRRIDPTFRVGVIIGNLAAQRQVSRITRHGYQALPLVTDNVTAVHIRDSLSRFDLERINLLIIEADVNALNSVECDLGQHRRVCVFSVAGGDDKATEYPFLVAGSDLVLLTKTDLLPYVSFDFKVFVEDVKRLEPHVDIMRASAQTFHGIKDWATWVESRVFPPFDNRAAAAAMFDPFVNWNSRSQSAGEIK
ncbi:MAG TPA: hydrogenase nickel incorporation protein HypB [Tepidisphaeraceae bacterium]|jgi:hydrogenase nickel incorporation protein HypB